MDAVNTQQTDHLAEIRRARADAHLAFDRFWKTGLIGRELAYHKLAAWMKLPLHKAHFGEFTVEQCRQVMEFLEGVRVQDYQQQRRSITSHRCRDKNLRFGRKRRIESLRLWEREGDE